MVKAATAAALPAPPPGPVPVPGTAAVISSAALISIGDVPATRNGYLKKSAGESLAWQAEAWEFYDTIPELRFGVQWLANTCSRARLFAARVDPDNTSEPEPLTDDKYVQPVAELFGGQPGQAEALRRITTLLSIPGETFIVAWDDPESDRDREWLVLSRDEINFTGTGRTSITLPQDRTTLNLPPGSSMLLRLWRPHARYGDRADSPVLALRGVLRELAGLSAHVLATVNSRLAGAGVLFIPDSAVPANPAGTEGANPLHDDTFMATLLEAMVTPLKDPSSASAVVPVIARLQDEAVGKIQHVDFSTALDENVNPLRESALKRLAIGMDLPPEILLGLGMSASSSWNAFAVEESSLKVSVAPMLTMICQGLTDRYYRPALKAAGVPDPENYTIWADTSELVQRPNRGPDALALYEQGLLSDETVLRAHGFDPDTDMPTDEQQKKFMIRRLLLANPSMLAYMFPELGGPGPVEPGGAGMAIAAKPQDPAGIPKDPARPVTGQKGPPQGPVMASAAEPGVLAEDAVVAALCRAGRRIRKHNKSMRELWRTPDDKAHTLAPPDAEQVTEMLRGQFDHLVASAGEPVAQAAALYTHRVLTTGTPHDPAVLAEFLNERGTR